MQEGAKRRLIGAAVVVVLLVIFLPMLLEEEETLHPVSEREMAIPPPPDFDQGYDASVLNPPVEPSVSTFPEYEDSMQEGSPSPQELPPPEFFETPAATRPELIPESDLAPVEETPPATKPKPAPKAASTPKPKAPPAAKPKPAPKAASVPKPAPTQPSAPAQSSSGPSSWVIQVASLREHARAYKLVQDLRVKGFPAYIQEARVNQKLWYRIRIGPEATRERIESMAASLRTKTGLRGQIQRYP